MFFLKTELKNQTKNYCIASATLLFTVIITSVETKSHSLINSLQMESKQLAHPQVLSMAHPQSFQGLIGDFYTHL